MDLIYFLLSHFYKEEYVNIWLMILTSFVISILQTNGISFITANIINAIKDNSKPQTALYFKYFMCISCVFIVLFGVYRHFQTVISTKLRQWVRNYLVKMVIVINNDNFNEQNFMKLVSPITRISTVSFSLFNDLITYFVPNLTFLIIVSGFFIYKNVAFGLGFLISNLLLFVYLGINIPRMMELNKKYETTINNTEAYLIEIFTNIDKIIYRGQSKYELRKFSEMSTNSINDSYTFYHHIDFHNVILTIFIYMIVFASIAFLIFMYFNKQIDITLFITFFTIILLYRDKITTIIQQIPDFVEFAGRTESVLKQLNNMQNDYTKIEEIEYAALDLPFSNIFFDDVAFKYKSAEKPLFEHLNMDIDTDGKIIGITGLSGNGKSTFAKLMLKMYKPSHGEIFIDDINLKEIDADYIRKHITYVNQTSKLFDRKVIDNILYGCSDADKCKDQLSEVMKYPKIQELYKNVNFDQESGSLGENLSGGQRQIVNVLSGLVNPCKILILDEPTNALDIELKQELLKVIRDFKKTKKCIIIITHDRDVFSLFDDEIKI